MKPYHRFVMNTCSPFIQKISSTFTLRSQASPGHNLNFLPAFQYFNWRIGGTNWGVEVDEFSELRKNKRRSERCWQEIEQERLKRSEKKSKGDWIRPVLRKAASLFLLSYLFSWAYPCSLSYCPQSYASKYTSLTALSRFGPRA